MNMQELWEAEFSSSMFCSTTIVNSASLTSHIFIGQLKQKPSESCPKDVKKLSKNNQNLSALCLKL